MYSSYNDKFVAGEMAVVKLPVEYCDLWCPKVYQEID